MELKKNLVSTLVLPGGFRIGQLRRDQPLNNPCGLASTRRAISRWPTPLAVPGLSDNLDSTIAAYSTSGTLSQVIQ